MRSVKQLIILAITVFVLGLGITAGGFLLSSIFSGEPEPEPAPPPPPPVVEVDPLDSIEVLKTQALRGAGGEFDIIIQLKNPNPLHGAEEIKYSVVFSSGGTEVFKINETTYILPGEEKYIVLPNMEVPSTFNDIRVDVQSVLWRQLNEFVTLHLDVFDLKLERLPEENTFYARQAAFVKNNSLFGLTDIRVFGILFNSGGDIIAANRTSIQTVLEGEMREVEMFWPQEIPLDEVAEHKVFAYSNVFRNDNFVRQFGVNEPIGDGGTKKEPDSRNYYQLPELFKRFQGWSPF